MTIEGVPDSQLLYNYPSVVERYGDIKSHGEWRVSERGKEPLLRQRAVGVYGGDETTWRLIPKHISRDEALGLIRLAEEWGMRISSFTGEKFIRSILELRDAIQSELRVLGRRLSDIHDGSAHGSLTELLMLDARVRYLDSVAKALNQYIVGVEEGVEG